MVQFKYLLFISSALLFSFSEAKPSNTNNLYVGLKRGETNNCTYFLQQRDTTAFMVDHNVTLSYVHFANIVGYENGTEVDVNGFKITIAFYRQYEPDNFLRTKIFEVDLKFSSKKENYINFNKPYQLIAGSVYEILLFTPSEKQLIFKNVSKEPKWDFTTMIKEYNEMNGTNYFLPRETFARRMKHLIVSRPKGHESFVVNFLNRNGLEIPSFVNGTDFETSPGAVSYLKFLMRNE